MVRYIDTGSRDPKQALGTWLGQELLGDTQLVELRVQSGFFGAGTLGYFERALDHVASIDGHTRILVGSNDGETPRAAIEDLLAVVGSPRPNLWLAVVSFQTGFFHPKVFHFTRADGSTTAYVGSANLTASGVRSQHVEAGLVLDTRDDDPVAVMDQIASAIDAWFIEDRGGFYPVAVPDDLESLVAAAVVAVPSPTRSARRIGPTNNGQQAARGRSLFPLVAMPAIQTKLPEPPPPDPDASATTSAGSAPAAHSQPSPPARKRQERTVAHWSKKLSASDAQRKRSGNQSGAVALTQGDYVRRIDQTTYFRQELFGVETWEMDTSTTGQPKEVAHVPMRAVVDGVDHGMLIFRVSNASNRESGQHNYTAQLHLEPLSPLFRQTDMTGKSLEMERFEDGEYELTIS